MSARIVCYFCNESFTEKQLQEHIDLCNSVLQECSNKCGAYLPRGNLQFHESQCLKSHPPSLPRNYRMDHVESEDVQYREKILSLLNVLTSMVKQSDSDKKQMMADSTIVKLRVSAMETMAKSLTSDLSNQSNNSRQIFTQFNQRLNNLDYNLHEVEGRTRASFDKVAHRLDSMQSNVMDQRTKQVEMLSDWEGEIRELKKFIANESILIGDIWDEHKKRMNDLKLELEMRCKMTEELADQHRALARKLEGLLTELQRNQETTGKQEKMIKALKYQLKDVIHYIEQVVLRDIDKSDSSSTRDFTMLHNCTIKGRLLWRIDKYKEKMTAAKVNDVHLLSPIFFNKDYGYALQMKLFLNGRDRWKDRNVIGCLQVIEGPWDPLLDWPCVLRATVTLRDQDNPANNLRKIVKTKANFKERGDEGLEERESVIDMFIPHTVLTRYDGYTRNNVIFLDIQVTELRESLSTSSLIA